MKRPAGLLAVSLLLLFASTVGSADTLLGTISVSAGFAQAPQISGSFLEIMAGPYDPINITCNPCFTANFAPSNSPQSVDFTASDANFAAIAADFSSAVDSWLIWDFPDGGLAGGGQGVGPWGAPGSTPTHFTITMSGFQFVQKEDCDFGFNQILPCTVTAGVSGPPVFEGYPLFTVTVEAFGTPAPAPEPVSLLLLSTGLAAVGATRRKVKR